MMRRSTIDEDLRDSAEEKAEKAESASEEITQVLTMRDIRKLLKKDVSESVNRVKRDTKNMVDSSEEKTVKEIEKINLQVTHIESEIQDISMQVNERQQKAGEEPGYTRDESQNFAKESQGSESEAQGSAEKATKAIERIEEEVKDMEQRMPQALAVNTAQEKKNKLKIIQSDDNLTEIEVEGKGIIGKFSKIGYYFHSGQLHIHNPETGVDIVIPSEFNLLKVVENREIPTHYMLVLTNQLGNKLFEYKKYDSTFFSLADEFKSLDLQQVKTLSKINFQS